LGSADVIKRTPAQDNKQEDVTKKYNLKKKLFHNFKKLAAKSETNPEVIFIPSNLLRGR
jgi:hypothetical protein